jgi:SOS response regulatory protein OraA/RecX
MKLNQLRQLIREEISKVLTSSNIEQFINDKDFMESFIANAEEAYEYFGDFKNMFDIYEEEGLTEEQIGDLLEYCDKNDLISY